MSDQRTGQADTAPQAHIDAVADLIESGHYIPGNPPERVMLARDDARRILDSTDPDVHAALLDALTRHGVLRRHWRNLRPCGCRAGVPSLMCCDPEAETTIERCLATEWEPTQ